ncbi:hypothetical protein NQ176_g10718 [Zarea fungicola]|uniref:Uncharacterized protein n=1 Tax=Zarea fungicola TaxID=93591 RepID=A0ACC1MDW7_9HYPO|nr:hypothetical protein NQ176_g10718 [Lecanicillium fungicola]
MNVPSMDEQSMSAFPLFSQFPVDIRRKIWVATLGPMTVTFVLEPPPRKDEELPAYIPEDLSWCTPEELAHYTIPPLFSNFRRYYGYVELSDGSSRLHFVAKASAAYRACKESREFLKFIFAEPVKPGGGLPSWFRFDIDTIRFSDALLPTIARYPWFTQAQHLHVVIAYGIDDYIGPDSDADEYMEGKNHVWIEKNLLSLKDITFDMRLARYGDFDQAVRRVCEDWFQVFLEWYNWSEIEKPVPYYARVIFLENGTTERELLTPTNYLRIEKMYYTEHYQKHFPGPNWKDHILHQRTRSIVEATNEELENPTDFLAKHRPFWD